MNKIRLLDRMFSMWSNVLEMNLPDRVLKHIAYVQLSLRNQFFHTWRNKVSSHKSMLRKKNSVYTVSVSAESNIIIMSSYVSMIGKRILIGLISFTFTAGQHVVTLLFAMVTIITIGCLCGTFLSFKLFLFFTLRGLKWIYLLSIVCARSGGMLV